MRLQDGRQLSQNEDLYFFLEKKTEQNLKQNKFLGIKTEYIQI